MYLQITSFLFLFEKLFSGQIFLFPCSTPGFLICKMMKLSTWVAHVFVVLVVFIVFFCSVVGSSNSSVRVVVKAVFGAFSFIFCLSLLMYKYNNSYGHINHKFSIPFPARIQWNDFFPCILPFFLLWSGQNNRKINKAFHTSRALNFTVLTRFSRRMKKIGKRRRQSHLFFSFGVVWIWCEFDVFLTSFANWVGKQSIGFINSLTF